MKLTRSTATTRSAGMLAVLGFVFLLIILSCAGVSVYLYYNIKSLAVSMFRQPIVTMVENSGLPDDQKQAIVRNVDRLGTEFEAGHITADQLSQIGFRLMQGNFFTLVQLELLETEYLQRFELTADEQAKVERDVDRFQRGMVQGTLSETQIEDTMGLVMITDEQGEKTVKSPLTDAELKTFIAQVHAAVADSAVPDESYQVDFAARFDEAINYVLTGPPTGTQPGPATTPAPAPAPPEAPATAPVS